ncbi:FKBP-type peptidyl-prolyl cis-trans isomerase [Glacieibacterium frigidum]|uniref:Peptidyl-prolyl cis-trans isomerase n=1 Tax=Glacieibacterium frigidum TaxID=2593303 RepID=A0A552UGB4_9SPHN|nr:FKBP-type peptidyl-prolyl cis-trans isomerase [Glacieibacterium frigidum]TRW17255.1 FKBP-type peptidyl-prolyl cis-trans isomerase [Glacieibacterium frigidum]
MADSAARSGSARWIVVAIVVAALVGGLVWLGTQSAVDAVRPADAAYLKANKGKPGVITTASGLQYQVLTEGKGAKPTKSDTVAVHYEGKLIDGTVFDSSYQRGQPAVFPLDAVIPGWTEGVQLMTTGSKYRFVIPPELGYGKRGAPGAIPPNSVLLFDVELLAVRGA